MSVVKELVNGRQCEWFGHEPVNIGGVQIRTACDESSLIGGVQDAMNSMGCVCLAASSRISSITIRLARRILVTTRMTLPSDRWARISALSSSRGNHATRIPASAACWLGPKGRTWTGTGCFPILGAGGDE